MGQNVERSGWPFRLTHRRLSIQKCPLTKNKIFAQMETQEGCCIVTCLPAYVKVLEAHICETAVFLSRSYFQDLDELPF